MVLILDASDNTGQGGISVRINTDSGYNYKIYGMNYNNAASYSANLLDQANQDEDKIQIARMTATASSKINGYVRITGCNSSGVKMFQGAGAPSPSSSNGGFAQVIGGFWDSSSSVTSISVVGGNNLDNGTVFVYTSA
jgi:hypothetical protein